jgi:vacuolar-type H+-ATPase subunit I/STV1
MGKDNYSADFVDQDLEQGDNTPVRPATPPSHVTFDPKDPKNLQEEAEAYRKKIQELEQEKEKLHKKTIIIEESRRRQIEFRQGRQELMLKMTRGIEILSEAHKIKEQELRSMNKNIGELKERLAVITDLQSSEWPEKEFESRLTAALIDLEKSRSEWNRQLAKYPKILRSALNGPEEVILPEAADGTPLERLPLNGHNLKYLCKLGFALTWPLALAILVVGILFLIFQ